MIRFLTKRHEVPTYFIIAFIIFWTNSVIEVIESVL